MCLNPMQTAAGRVHDRKHATLSSDITAQRCWHSTQRLVPSALIMYVISFDKSESCCWRCGIVWKDSQMMDETLLDVHHRHTSDDDEHLVIASFVVKSRVPKRCMSEVQG